jgi:MacB-like periplasmic core domain
MYAGAVLNGPIQLARQAAQDSRLTMRQWARRPLSTGFAILALAIGIGANTGIFSVVNALLLRSLPFRNSERLATPHYNPTPHMTRKQFHEWPSQTSYLEDAATFDHGEANFGGADGALRVHLTETSSNFFSLLGASPVLGRAFAPDEDTPGRDHVAILGYALWHEVFAGDSKALGSTIQVDGSPNTIIGVMPPGFDYPDETTVWIPTTFDRLASERSPFVGGEILRLRAGVSWAQANAAFTAEQTRLAPDRVNPAHPPSLMPLKDALAGPV